LKILALDGNSLAYRAFFALPTEMATVSGQVTNAVFGFVTMLTNLVKEQKPDGLVVVFDRREKTFRHDAAPEYKAQRESQPDILYQQLEIIREVLGALGIQVLDKAGFEGDDLIATVVERASEIDADVVVVTGDRDAYQLVRDPHVKVLYNKRGVTDYALYDEAGIFDKTGVTPRQYPEYAAMRGDTSDNLEGVQGVGEKTAAKLMAKYGSLRAILDAADEQTPKLAASLKEGRERALRNLELMTLRRDVPIELDLQSLAPRPDLVKARSLFNTLEFKALTQRALDAFARFSDEPLPAAEPTKRSGVASSSTTRKIESVEDAVAVFEQWRELDRVTILVPDGGEGGVAVADDRGNGVWIVGEVASSREVIDAASRIKALVGHECKSVLRWLLRGSGALPRVEFDTLVAAYLIDPALGQSTLGELASRFVDEDLPSLNAASDELDFGGASEARALAWAEHASFVMHLTAAMREAIESIDATKLLNEIELPLISVLARMEHVGVGVNRDRLQEINSHLEGAVAQLLTTIHQVAGKEFNVNSPAQLRQILFEERKLTPGKKTKTGFSTDAATLERLRDEWPEFIDPLLRYRELEKLRSTYGTGLLEAVAGDGRIHATFNQTVARTGRLSSDAPNLHNIPVRSDEGKVFREVFVPSEGWRLLVADYNQIELRCIAHLAADPGLIDAFNKGEDIHRTTAARVFGVAESEVTPDQRSQAKMVSYGLAYGMEAYGLSQRLAIGVDEASEILDSYFGAFPKVRQYMDEAVAEARRRGFTETLFGRRRPIPELNSDNFRIRQVGERQAMNAGIQGLAADIFKIALVKIQQSLDQLGIRSRLILQVHDEVIVESPEEEREIAEREVLAAMRGAASLLVPLEVNFAWGDSWATAKS
jgi:DNA polymerase-1